MKYFLEALNEALRKGKAGDPNGKFTFNQLMELVKRANELEQQAIIHEKIMNITDTDGVVLDDSHLHY